MGGEGRGKTRGWVSPFSPVRQTEGRKKRPAFLCCRKGVAAFGLQTQNLSFSVSSSAQKEQVKLWKVLTSVEFESISCRVFVALLEKGAEGGGGRGLLHLFPSAKVRNLV